MKLIKSIGQLLGFCVIVGGTFWFGYECSKLARPLPKPAELPSLINIQERIGAKPDGIYGTETKTLWETAYANQEAAKFMTADGSPRKEN